MSATTPSTATTPSKTTAPTTGGAWTNEGASGVDWIHYPVSAGPRPAGTNEYLCTTYYEYAAGLSGTKGVSGDVYALVTTPTNAGLHGCAPELPAARHSPPHRLRVDHPDQQLQSARLRVRGSHQRQQRHLHRIRAVPLRRSSPPGMSGASEKFSFWT